jgi:hypothetical protein
MFTKVKNVLKITFLCSADIEKTLLAAHPHMIGIFYPPPPLIARPSL